MIRVPNWDGLSKRRTWGIIGNCRSVIGDDVGHPKKLCQNADRGSSALRRSFSVHDRILKARGTIQGVADDVRKLNPGTKDLYDYCKSVFDGSKDKLYSIESPRIPLVRALVRWYYHDVDILTQRCQTLKQNPAAAFRMGLSWQAQLDMHRERGDGGEVMQAFNIPEFADAYHAFVDLSVCMQNEATQRV